MIVTLQGNAKEAQSIMEGSYILKTNLVNKKPWWKHRNGRTAIWHANDGYWWIGLKEYLGRTTFGDIRSKEDPLQALTWEYWKSGWHKSKDIFVTASNTRNLGKKTSQRL